MDMFTCRSCQKSKSRSEFYTRAGARKDTRYKDCKKCHNGRVTERRRERKEIDPEGFRESANASAKKWREKNPALVKKSNAKGKLKQRYNTTPEVLASMVEEQNNACAICGSPLDPPHIDHDHNTGAIRGLLCGSCNRAIGLLQDSVEVLESAIDYLQRGTR